MLSPFIYYVYERFIVDISWKGKAVLNQGIKGKLFLFMS